MKKMYLIFSSILIAFSASAHETNARKSAPGWLGQFTSPAVLYFPGQNQKQCDSDYEDSKFDSENGLCVLNSKDGNSITIESKNNDWQVEVFTIYGPANQRMFTGQVNSVHFGSNGITTIKATASTSVEIEEGNIGSGSSDCEELTIELSKHQSVARVIIPTGSEKYCDPRLDITGQRKK